MLRILLTGGAGFIGSALVRHFIEHSPHEIVNVDKLTYAANRATACFSHPRYRFFQVDICDRPSLGSIFSETRPDAVMHLAAESHVDRSIDDPGTFLNTNVIGTYNLLDAALAYWRVLDAERRDAFRFHHISTDEVFGDLEPEDPPFTEQTPYRPSSPYSASKAASDHLVRAWQRTYGLPIVISNTSNNYGPGQFPEKLIPLIILNAIEGRPLPVYGDGLQVRDWIYVYDHAEALARIVTGGRVGETYNVGGQSERRNIDVVRTICAVLEEARPEKPAGVARYEDLIVSVADRPGHDRRYGIDSRKIMAELDWNPRETFESGLRRTVFWYLDNRDWCEGIRVNRYDGERIGLAASERDGAR